MMLDWSLHTVRSTSFLYRYLERLVRSLVYLPLSKSLSEIFLKYTLPLNITTQLIVCKFSGILQILQKGVFLDMLDCQS